MGFLDDDPTKRSVRHLPVLGSLSDVLRVATEECIDVVVLAIPGLPEADVARLATAAARVGASVRRLPSFVALLQRDVVGTDMRSLDVSRLIGRSELHVASPEVGEIIAGKRVLVTGAGGSIGSELCRQVNGFGPAGCICSTTTSRTCTACSSSSAARRSSTPRTIVLADIRDARRLSDIFAQVPTAGRLPRGGAKAPAGAGAASRARA